MIPISYQLFKIRLKREILIQKVINLLMNMTTLVKMNLRRVMKVILRVLLVDIAMVASKVLIEE